MCYHGLVSFQLIFYTSFLFWFSRGDDFFLVGNVSLGSGQILIVVELNGGLLRLIPISILCSSCFQPLCSTCWFQEIVVFVGLQVVDLCHLEKMRSL